MHINFLAIFFLLSVVSAVPLPTALKPASERASLSLAAPRIPVIAPAHSKLSCTPHLVKRQDGLVQKAVLAVKEQVEDGLSSKTLLTTYDGQPAILKIIRKKEREKEVIKEVRNLKTVRQFLGWGHNTDKSIFYIIMRKMGEPLEIANKEAKGALSDIFPDLELKAFQRYESVYGLRHLDIHHHNYVFRETSPGKWQAELIDWSDAAVMNGAQRPCEGEAELVTIDLH